MNYSSDVGIREPPKLRPSDSVRRCVFSVIEARSDRFVEGCTVRCSLSFPVWVFPSGAGASNAIKFRTERVSAQADVQEVARKPFSERPMNRSVLPRRDELIVLIK